MRLLVVEDEKDLNSIIVKNLEAEGYIYSVAGKGSFVSGTADADAARRETLRADVKKLLNELRYLGVTEADAAALIKEVYEQ